MLDVWIYAIASVLVISLVSFIGVFTLAVKEKLLKRILLLLVSLSAGALLGGAFMHLVPEGLEEFGMSLKFFVYILIGVLIFFILEKIVRWRHCHDVDCDIHHPQSIGPMILFGDSLHNFIDGLIIGGSFLVSVPVGIAATIAVVLHEIPQEIGDFGVLLHGGYSKKKALLFNFLSALTAVVGAVVALLIGAMSESFVVFLLPFAAGGFIYIAASDLIPELHKETKLKGSLFQTLFFVIGIVLMYLLTFLG